MCVKKMPTPIFFPNWILKSVYQLFLRTFQWRSRRERHRFFFAKLKKNQWPKVFNRHRFSTEKTTIGSTRANASAGSPRRSPPLTRQNLVFLGGGATDFEQKSWKTNSGQIQPSLTATDFQHDLKLLHI
jgi:hypothetical protein